MIECKHEGFSCDVAVNRLEDCGRFMADLSIKCDQCGIEMVFLGLPRGVDLKGAATNTSGTEARLAIHPQGETVPEMALGFQQREMA